MPWLRTSKDQMKQTQFSERAIRTRAGLCVCVCVCVCVWAGCLGHVCFVTLLCPLSARSRCCYTTQPYPPQHSCLTRAHIHTHIHIHTYTHTRTNNQHT